MKSLAAPLLLFVALFLCLLLTVPACGGIDCKDPKNASSTGCVAEKSVIDCTAPDIQTYVLSHVAEVAKCFKPAPDYACLETSLLHLGASEAYCVLEHEFDHYLATGSPSITPPPASEGGVVKTTLPSPPADPAPLIAKKNELAAKLWPGKTVKK